jgi:transposase
MSQQGKRYSPDVVDLVIHLKEHYDQERRSGKVVSTRDPAGRTAQGLGIGIRTVKSIMVRHARGESVHTTSQRAGRPPKAVCTSVQTVVRAYVHAENLAGRRVSIENLRRHLVEECEGDVPKTTLWRALRRWGFTYGQGRRRDSLKEQDELNPATPGTFS